LPGFCTIIARPSTAGRGFAHEVFARAPDIRDTILPIDFSEKPEAARRNIETRKEALSFLARGGAVGIFPGGTVSTPLTPFGVAMDPEWRRFTAKMVARSGASVLPVFFEGANSRAFHLASHISTGLRLGLLLHEFRKQLDRPIRVHIGKVIPPEALAPFVAQPKSMMDFLREQTYGLSPQPLDWQILGKDFG
jgi:putative hemolysin